MSASSDMHNRGYFARIRKDGEVLHEQWFATDEPAVDFLIDILRGGGWPAGEYTLEAEKQVRDAITGVEGYGARLDVGGAHVFTSRNESQYTYELRSGYRPGYTPARSDTPTD